MDGMIDMLDFLIPYTVRAKLWAGKKRYLLLFQEAAIMDKKLAYYQEKAREKAREEWDRFEACTALDFLNTVNFDFPMDGAPSRFERDPSPLGRTAPAGAAGTSHSRMIQFGATAPAAPGRSRSPE